MNGANSSEWWTLLERSVRGRLSAVSIAVRGAHRGQTAWETLIARELVPLEWASSAPGRAFIPRALCDACTCGRPNARRLARRGAAPRSCAVCALAASAQPFSPIPTSEGDMIAFALNPTAVATAEALAFEVAARLDRGTVSGRRVLWRFRTRRDASLEQDHPLRRGDVLGERVMEIWEAVTCASDAGITIPERHKSAFEYLRREAPVPSPGTWHLGVGAVWRAGQAIVAGADAAAASAHDAAGAGLTTVDAWLVSCAAIVRDAVAAALERGDWYSEQLAESLRRANPFEPAIAIWQLGFGIEAVTDDAVVLFAPSFCE